MLDWMKTRRSKAVPRSEAGADAAKQQGTLLSGTYRYLYKYLEDRYANTVVLTFAEIEDLLGFALPDVARLRPDWWTATDADPARPSYSHAWRQASRTATPNLLAKTVVFERAV